MNTKGKQLLPAGGAKSKSKVYDEETKKYNEKCMQAREQLLLSMQKHRDWLDRLEEESDYAMFSTSATESHYSRDFSLPGSTTKAGQLEPYSDKKRAMRMGKSEQKNHFTYVDETKAPVKHLGAFDKHLATSLPHIHSESPTSRSTRSLVSESDVDVLKMNSFSEKEKRQLQIKVAHVRGMLKTKGLSNGWMLVDAYDKQKRRGNQTDEKVLSALITHLARHRQTRKEQDSRKLGGAKKDKIEAKTGAQHAEGTSSAMCAGGGARMRSREDVLTRDNLSNSGGNYSIDSGISVGEQPVSKDGDAKTQVDDPTEKSADDIKLSKDKRSDKSEIKKTGKKKGKGKKKAGKNKVSTD